MKPYDPTLVDLQGPGQEHDVLDDVAADDDGMREMVVQGKIEPRTVIGEEYRSVLRNVRMGGNERVPDAQHPRAQVDQSLEKVDGWYRRCGSWVGCEAPKRAMHHGTSEQKGRHRNQDKC